MSTDNIFEQASRVRPKLRFDSVQGPLTVEDLWDLDLQTQRSNKASLYDIGNDLNKQVKEATDDVLFSDEVSKVAPTLQLKLDIVKHVVEAKKAENAAKLAEAARNAKKQQIMGLIVQKENEQLSASSLEDLRAQLASL